MSDVCAVFSTVQKQMQMAYLLLTDVVSVLDAALRKLERHILFQLAKKRIPLSLKLCNLPLSF